MAKKLKVGFVGIGSIAQGSHVPGWQTVPDAEIVAAADINEQTLAKGGELAGIAKDHLYTDYRKMLREVELDIVDVCTPNCVHKAPTIAAFKAGCHVIVEKPMTVSVADGRQMIKAGHDAGKLLMVGQCMRFMEDGLAMKRWVDEGLVGDIYWGRASYLRPRGVPAWGAFADKEMSAGGPCYDLGVHILDLCLWLMGHPEPVSVSANIWLEISNKPSLMKHDPKKFTVPDELAAGFIRFRNGVCLSLETSWAINAPVPHNGIFLAGTKGGIQNNPATLVREEAGMLVDTTVQVNPDAGIKSHHEEIRQFADAVRKARPSPVPGEEALLTQRILDGIYKSAAQGKEVKV